jgi:hypothetical protein
MEIAADGVAIAALTVMTSDRWNKEWLARYRA